MEENKDKKWYHKIASILEKRGHILVVLISFMAFAPAIFTGTKKVFVIVVLCLLCALFVVYLWLQIGPFVKSPKERKRIKQLTEETLETQGMIDRCIIRGKNLENVKYKIMELDPNCLPVSQTSYLGESLTASSGLNICTWDIYGHYVTADNTTVKFCMSHVDWPDGTELPKSIDVRYHPVLKENGYILSLSAENGTASCTQSHWNTDSLPS